MGEFKINTNQVSLLQRMALSKYRSMSIEEYAESINKSREVARRDLKNLLQKGFLVEEKKGKKFVYYVDSKELRNRVANIMKE